MKKTKKLGNIFFWMTLVSPIISFSLASEIGEANIFGVMGIVRYSWIMWFFIPIGVLSILIGTKLKKHKQNHKKNFIIAFICLPLIIIFGSYRFVFYNISYDTNKVVIIEEEIKLELPNQIKIATNTFDSYNLSYLKIIDEESKAKFEYTLETNTLWQKELSSEIKNLLPFDIQYEVETFDCFLFYNSLSNEHIRHSLNVECEECKYIFVAYDYELQKLIILDDFKIN